MADWNSRQYLRFVKERTQPSVDLINRIAVENPCKILDVGCGPGNSTAELARRFPDAAIMGIDNSRDMIDRARMEYPGMDFLLGDITLQNFAPESFDIVFSNAAIQWIPDHRQLIPYLFGLVKPGGVLACQIPMNHNEPSHSNIRELAGSKEWKGRFENMRIFNNLAPEEYYDLFTSLGATFDMWLTTYYHPMSSHGDIVEWLKGTGLRAYMTSLCQEEWKEFEDNLLERYAACYPVQENGKVVLRFPRFFFLLTK